MHPKSSSIAWLALAILAAAAARASAQTPPDLSGKWLFADERNPRPEVGPRPNYGTEFTIRQDATGLTMERVSGAQINTFVYPADGSEKETAAGTTVTKTRSHWEGSTFVMDVTNTSMVGASPVTTTSKRRIWREGDDLVTEWANTSPVRTSSVSIYRRPPAASAPAPPAKAKLTDVAWLAGNWERRLGTSLLEERWIPPAGGAMLGVSRTVSGERMAAFEFLRLIERDGTLVYVAQPNGRTATEFTLTLLGTNEAVFENPAHDFPKIVTYRLAADGTLTAIIADTGGLKPQYFIMKKAGGASEP